MLDVIGTTVIESHHKRVTVSSYFVTASSSINKVNTFEISDR
jgi:hypothetical protein